MKTIQTGIPFLDTWIQITDGKIIITPYHKPTDRKQYISMNSCHPYHQQIGIAYSQALRLKRICSDPNILEDELMTLRTNRQKPHEKYYYQQIVPPSLETSTSAERQPHNPPYRHLQTRPT